MPATPRTNAVICDELMFIYAVDDGTQWQSIFWNCLVQHVTQTAAV